MPVAIALIVGVVVLAISLIGLLWTIAMLLPFYAYIGAAVYLVWRSNRTEADMAASAKHDTDRQRLFNEQEERAWRDSLYDEKSRNASKQEEVLRRFDSTRDPPAT